MPVFSYNKSYRELIRFRLDTIRIEMVKIEKTIGSAYLAGKDAEVKVQRDEWNRLNAEKTLLEDIQAAVVREHGSYKYAEW